MSAGMQISGNADLERALKQIGDVAGRRHVNRGLRKAARRVEDKALLNFARVTTERTGGLANSVGIKTQTKKGARIFIIGPRISGGHQGFHGHLVESGTKERVQGVFGRNVGRMPATPWLGPAFEQTEARNRQAIINEINRGIERDIKKMARAG